MHIKTLVECLYFSLKMLEAFALQNFSHFLAKIDSAVEYIRNCNSLLVTDVSFQQLNLNHLLVVEAQHKHYENEQDLSTNRIAHLTNFCTSYKKKKKKKNNIKLI